jgi:hypothetical protein
MKTRGETVHYLYILIYVGKYSYYGNPAEELLHLQPDNANNFSSQSIYSIMILLCYQIE